MAKARHAKAKADLDYAKAQLSYATIKAPISGTIASVTTQEGETVAAGLSAPTFITIIDLHRLEVNAYVDETDVGKIAVGQEALFTVDTFPDKDFKGKVTAIYPRAVLQENVVNYITLISIANPEGALKPDMTANVTITLKKKTGVLAVPGAAIRREGGKKFVSVAGAEGKTVKREVKTGWKEGSFIEITSGLKEGEVVVMGEGNDKK
jgi:macrolide-specific efflux system membrane fusion protein